MGSMKQTMETIKAALLERLEAIAKTRPETYRPGTFVTGFRFNKSTGSYERNDSDTGGLSHQLALVIGRVPGRDGEYSETGHINMSEAMARLADLYSGAFEFNPNADISNVEFFDSEHWPIGFGGDWERPTIHETVTVIRMLNAGRSFWNGLDEISHY